MTKARVSTDQKSDGGKLERKWGKLAIQAGWLGFPSVFLQRQRALRLDPLDLNILLQIADHWWEQENLPYPSKKTIAKRIGVDPRTVQRRIAQMENDGLIRRNPRRHSSGGSKTNTYSFDGLIREAEPYAKEILNERAIRKRERSDRDIRKRPKLRVV
jgi:DNA-binding transcriptional regulator YhcF (GntR family)